MRIVTCDRCGAKLTPELYENTGYIALRWRGYFDANLGGVNPFENCDFCQSCMDEIKEFINTPKMLPVPAVMEEDADKSDREDTEAEAADAGQDPEEPKPKRKYHRLDDELFKQYAGLGLTYEEIKMRLYHEHGIVCNRQTVANHMHKLVG